ncbi:sensor histidine kinase [Streptomyces colonosanans]|uniref:Two-component sensor histidine kinase n=1 Tax=Streptomyces colonosanans TaxID=1428652 RepID=A0A1S2NXB5_9ACTN|nr:sensor histidine kinase [Streptomyces colonosanans]OIJ86149.1 two-component sensor histidine kinase [Streptomyces colonosanans]
MSWLRKAPRRLDAWRLARRAWKQTWKEDKKCFKAERKAARKAGKAHEEPGPPPSGFTLLPWLLLGMGSFSNLFQGKTPNPWIGGVGLFAFNSLYIYVAFRAFCKETREAASTRLALVLLGLVTCALAIGYGGNWLMFFPLLGLATGAIVRGPWLGKAALGLSALAGAVAGFRVGTDAINIVYGTFLSTMVTAAILGLAEAVRELRAAREELARRAVEKERLRFSRDLHDLLGHTLSVIVVKSEAARRLAHRDLEAALVQVTDIESVGRQALVEIREAVTGYREGSLATELDRARSALTAAGIEPVVRRSGPPLVPQTEALLGWVVREAVTNAVRHSGATRCEISVDGTSEHIRLTVADNGNGASSAPRAEGIGGTGLKGLTERLAAAGGSLRAGPSPHGGFTVTAELPVESERPVPAAEPEAVEEPPMRAGAHRR